MTYDVLRAKSGKNGRTVEQHTLDVVDAAMALFGTAEELTPLGQAWCRLFKLDGEAGERFAHHLVAAAYCHDLGKASDSFQREISNREGQLYRHEHLSLLLMRDERFRMWLGTGVIDADLLDAAVAGHHLKLGDDGCDLLEHMNAGRGGEAVELLHGDGQVRRTLERLGKAAGLAKPADGWQGRWDGGAVDDARDELASELDDLHFELEAEPNRKRLSLAIRSALIAADAAGSGLVRNRLPLRDWIADAFSATLNAKLVREQIVGQRLSNIGKTIADLNPFQQACGDPTRVPERALLLAPCGSGKTLAAWNWIAARCDERPRGAAIFLYPTRGTATEGYHDYASLAGEDVARLVHGTAELDLDDVLADAGKDAERLREARLYSLAQWPRRIFSATADQFLAFAQHDYAATCHLPLLAGAAVVVDEVHAFDRGMFSALVKFLEEMDVPVLCMTATLSENRRKKLEQAGLTTINGLELGGEETDLVASAKYARYEVEAVADAEAAEAEVWRALEGGRRVLWVVNAVDRCQAIAKRFPDAFCYHSRFKLDDRRRAHEAVVGAFKGERDGSRLAVTTQVCEMSLDLDADVLVTELCPASSLVQRMGRCCRDRRAHQTGRTGRVLVYEPEHRLPYKQVELDTAGGMLDAIAGTGVSQAELEEHLEQVDAVEMPRPCRFFESGVWASGEGEQFRDIDDLVRQALLPEDVNEYKRRRASPRPWTAAGLVLSVPKKLAQPHGEYDLPRYLELVTSGVYDPRLGHLAAATKGALIC